jgi:hypothetical protein
MIPGWYFLLLVATVLAQTPSATIDYSAAAKSISAVLNSPTFAPYMRPAGKTEEFIALGDSYMAGIGSNGEKEVLGGAAERGERAFPMLMSKDYDN